VVRRLVLACALAFAGLFAALTAYVLITSGPDPLAIASLLVVALVAVGAVGALREPPE
jgi:hypothetical protein